MPNDDTKSELNTELELLMADELTPTQPSEPAHVARYRSLLIIIGKLSDKINYLIDEDKKTKLLNSSEAKRMETIKTIIITVVMSVLGAAFQWFLKKV